MASCRACSAPIKFAVHTSTGKSHPVNGILKCRKASLPADYSRPRHKSHFATCPKAEQFRRRGK